MPDYQRLQRTLDEVAQTVEWAAGWIEYLEDEELNGIGVSDREILRADIRRLRLVADALVPGRISDPGSSKRWYLAPDEADSRERDLSRALDAAERDVNVVAKAVADRRSDAKRKARERDDRHQRQHDVQGQLATAEGKQVAAFLAEHGPATAKEIAAGTGLNSFAAARAAKAVAKRGPGMRFTLTE
jgi:hypothetical protein